MHYRDTNILDRIRARLGKKPFETIATYKGGELVFQKEDIDPTIISLNKTQKQVDENDIAEAIQTISIGTGIPVGEIVLSLKRLQRQVEHLKQFSKVVNGGVSIVNEFSESINKAISSINEFSETLTKEINSLDKTRTSSDTDHTSIDLEDSFAGSVHVLRNNLPLQDVFKEYFEMVGQTRHTSRHIPFYFPVFDHSRFVPKKSGGKPHTKFNRNVRPKGTHSHFRFYR